MARKRKGTRKTTHEFTRGAQLMRATDDAHVGEDAFPEIQNVKQRLFLQAIAANGPRTGLACRAAGIDVTTGWQWRNGGPGSTPEFMEAYERALKLGIERCEAELIRRGFHGMEKPIYQHGRLVGTVQTYDTAAATFMLKGMAPEKYRDRVEHSGPHGGPIAVASLQLRAELAGLGPGDLLQRLQAVSGALGLPVGPVVADGDGNAPWSPPEVGNTGRTAAAERDPAEAYRQELQRRGQA